MMTGRRTIAYGALIIAVLALTGCETDDRGGGYDPYDASPPPIGSGVVPAQSAPPIGGGVVPPQPGPAIGSGAAPVPPQ